MGINGAVKVWKMTEEERLAYIEKHPILPTEKPKGFSYDAVDYTELNKRKRENAKKAREAKKKKV